MEKNDNTYETTWKEDLDGIVDAFVFEIDQFTEKMKEYNKKMQALKGEKDDDKVN